VIPLVPTAVALAAMLLAGTASAQALQGADASRAALAPTGALRAAINFGNPVLAQRGPEGTPQGVSTVLAAELARRLGVPLVMVPFESAGAVTAALPKGVYDVAFMAVDPVRGEGMDFTAPYVLIEGAYVVRAASAATTNEAVDAPGTTVAVAAGSAYDLYLTRALKQASLARLPTGNDAATAFLAGQHDVLAGVKSPVAKLVAQTPGLRLLPGRFMAIDQAMAVPKGRDPAALATLQAFIAEMKASGTVARALAETGQSDAEVAP
jgi:polar amino acid transport system substrate-binding protein